MKRTPEAEAALARRRERSISRRWHLLLALLVALALFWAADAAQSATSVARAGDGVGLASISATRVAHPLAP
jgi:hypothetical protein